MKIAVSQGRMNKIHVSVDGEYMFTVDSEFWYTCRWSRISEITDADEQTEFMNEVGSRYAFISGLRALSYSDCSRKTMRLKLVNKGHKPEFVDIALDKLCEYGYIDDMRFSRYMRDRLMNSKHMSRNGIRQELISKGVDRETAEAALSEVEFDPVDDICALLTGKYSRYLGDEKGRKKTVAALQRLGYGWSDIRSALSRAELDTEVYDE